MPVNYAEKYSNKVDERFTQGSLTDAAFNKDYDWDGVSTVNVYSVSSVPLNDYTMTGNSRYGTPDELGNEVQAMTLSQDKSFTFTIDRRNYEDTMMVQEAGRSLRRQIDEQVVPTVDKYRLAKLIAMAGTTSAAAAITKTNAYEVFLDGVTTLMNNNAPLSGTVAFISTNFYKFIRLDSAFIKSSDKSQDMVITGQVGTVENIPLIYVPTVYFPAGVEFVLANKMAAVSPIKLSDYRTHENPPGVNGWLVEGRIYYDAFVLDSKKKAIYVHKSE